MNHADVAIVGGGIVGLATAYNLTQRYPDLKIVVLEKEKQPAAHQTGHNSGVLHSGIYYRPGSLKAINCRTGKEAMEAFCAAESIDYDICGKVIVAVQENELPRLQNIYERGQANGVRCEMIDQNRLGELEPHTAGIQAIHVPEAGIVNYRQVCQRMVAIVCERGHRVELNTRVTAVQRRADEIIVKTSRGDFPTRYLVNCAGLQCDRVMKLTGVKPQAPILPFRGEYFELKPEVKHLCRNLIYPVPDPSFPFLGVHFTRLIDGAVECGPNAVLAFAREGYSKFDISPRDLIEAITYRGFLRMAAKYWRVGLGEMWRSWSKAAFVKALQRLIPEIRGEHITAAPAGVRAQAISPQGEMVDDWLIQSGAHIVNVGNAPSPAATSSLNIGRLIVDD